MEQRQLWMSRMVEEIPDDQFDQAIKDELIAELESMSSKDFELAALNNDNVVLWSYFQTRGRTYNDLIDTLNGS
jgi:hypothetical protein